MPLYLTEADVRATLSMADAISALDDAARKIAAGKAMNAPRARVSSHGTMLQLLGAALDGRVGHKAYTVGSRGVTFWVTLYAPSGEMLAIIEANTLGQIRTGAASGLATRYLARSGARVLGSIGTGFQARTQIAAVCAVRPIERILAWGRDGGKLKRFCADVAAELGRSIEAAPSPEAAVAEADVVATMTSASEPVFDGRWLRAGTHINAAGSNRATAAEIDAETVQRAAVIAVEDISQAKIEAGDLLRAESAGAFTWSRSTRLADIVAGTAAGRTDDAQITLFESLGVGIWDLAAASHVYDACIRGGRGSELPFPG